MTKLDAARNAETAAKRLADVAIRLQNVANDLHVAAASGVHYEMCMAAFKRVQRQVNDIVASVNDAEMNIHTAK